jgi:hypothetical protein
LAVSHAVPAGSREVTVVFKFISDDYDDGNNNNKKKKKNVEKGQGNESPMNTKMLVPLLLLHRQENEQSFNSDILLISERSKAHILSSYRS